LAGALAGAAAAATSAAGVVAGTGISGNVFVLFCAMAPVAAIKPTINQ
jgi:hypothetical protein